MIHTIKARVTRTLALETDLALSVEAYSFPTSKGQVLTPVAEIVAREVLRAVTGRS